MDTQGKLGFHTVFGQKSEVGAEWALDMLIIKPTT